MPHVLVIDDDHAIHLLAQKSLSPIADVSFAATADEGLRLLKQNSFDAVLLDIVLPDRNGLAIILPVILAAILGFQHY